MASSKVRADGADSREALRQLRDRLWKRYTEPESSPRVVVIIGAGASRPSGMPTWDSLRATLVQKVADALTKDKRKEEYLRQFWETFSGTIGPWDPGSSDKNAERLLAMVTPESLLSAACRYQSLYEDLGELLRNNLTGGRAADDALHEPRPQLAYELIAHLVKHGFVDDVVSFNFDQVMETALNNELGPGNYHLLISDNQLSALAETSLRLPRLLKVHGSLDSPKSLRFTPESTGVLSSDLEALLNDAVLAPALEKKVDIISFGYSWQDNGFANWVTRNIGSVNSVTIIELGGGATKRMRERAAAVNRAKDIFGISVAKVLQKPKALASFTLDHFLWGLWDGIRHRYEQSDDVVQFLMPAERHLLLAYWFGGSEVKGEPDPPRMAHSARNRFTAELLLHIAKCKGMVNASVMARIPRLHSYYRKMNETNLSAETVMSEYLLPSKHAEVFETLFTKAATSQELAGQFVDFTFPQADGKPRELLRPAWDETSREARFKTSRVSERGPQSKLLREWMKQIFDAPEVEVDALIDERNEWLFRAPRPLPSYHALQAATARLLQKDWTHLLVVAESGEWLIKDAIQKLVTRRGGRVVCLITVSPDELEQWLIGLELKRKVDFRSRNVALVTGQMAWWRHNRHLTIALDASGDDVRYLDGIYFRRRHKASRIAPVVIRGHPNIEGFDRNPAELLLTFLAYTLRALEHARSKARLSDGRSKSTRPSELMLGKRVLELAERVRVIASFRDRLTASIERIRGELAELDKLSREVAAD